MKKYFTRKMKEIKNYVSRKFFGNKKRAMRFFERRRHSAQTNKSKKSERPRETQLPEYSNFNNVGPFPMNKLFGPVEGKCLLLISMHGRYVYEIEELDTNKINLILRLNNFVDFIEEPKIHYKSDSEFGTCSKTIITNGISSKKAALFEYTRYFLQGTRNGDFDLNRCSFYREQNYSQIHSLKTDRISKYEDMFPESSENIECISNKFYRLYDTDNDDVKMLLCFENGFMVDLFRDIDFIQSFGILGEYFLKNLKRFTDKETNKTGVTLDLKTVLVFLKGLNLFTDIYIRDLSCSYVEFKESNFNRDYGQEDYFTRVGNIKSNCAR